MSKAAIPYRSTTLPGLRREALKSVPTRERYFTDFSRRMSSRTTSKGTEILLAARIETCEIECQEGLPRFVKWLRLPSKGMRRSFHPFQSRMIKTFGSTHLYSDDT